MKNYKSLASPPHTDYTKFMGGLGGQAGPTEPIDNTAIKRLENHEKLQTREINRNSHDININTYMILSRNNMIKS